MNALDANAFGRVVLTAADDFFGENLALFGFGEEVAVIARLTSFEILEDFAEINFGGLADILNHHVVRSLESEVSGDGTQRRSIPPADVRQVLITNGSGVALGAAHPVVPEAVALRRSGNTTLGVKGEQEALGASQTSVLGEIILAVANSIARNLGACFVRNDETGGASNALSLGVIINAVVDSCSNSHAFSFREEIA
ncbi:MAG: hypothetical protein GY938_07750 [Ketobacter sp.]|nr:hypothetical protein [Ketobacter sp.]